MNETAFQNERGAIAVLTAMLEAFGKANPAAFNDGLANAQRLRDLLVNSRQPEAFLAGFDTALAYWQKVPAMWKAQPPAP